MSQPATSAGRNVTLPALIAMAAGFSLGLIARQTQSPLLLKFTEVADPLGTVWTNALRMVVLPLMVSYIVLAINSVKQARTAGKLGGIAMITWVSMLAVAGVFAFTAGSALLAAFPIDDAARAAFRGVAGKTVAPAVAPTASAPTVSGWLTAMVPANPLRAAVEDNFVGVVIATVLFSLAMMRITPARRSTLIGLFEAVAEVSGMLIGWIISLLPIAAFALSFMIAAQTGLSIAGSVVFFVVALSALTFLVNLFLFPVTAVIGRVGMGRFLSASAPALAVGAGTRSSIAALPAMLDGAENRLGIRREVSGFILPLSVSTFKLNPVISQIFEIMFLISIFDLHPSPAVYLAMAFATVLLCFASAGIPSGGKLLSWPALLAAGVPVQALVLMKVIDAIPDIFKTLLNVTADMSVAVIVQRFAEPELAEDAPVIAMQTE